MDIRKQLIEDYWGDEIADIALGMLTDDQVRELDKRLADKVATEEERPEKDYKVTLAFSGECRMDGVPAHDADEAVRVAEGWFYDEVDLSNCYGCEVKAIEVMTTD